MKQGVVGWGDINKRTFPEFKKPERCKWLIVGGGIAGLSAAHFLLKQGEQDIVLIEKHTIGSGSTGHSAGMLVFEPEQASWKHYVAVYGKSKAKAYYDAQQTALEIVRDIIVDNKIDCEYEKEELLVLANTKKERALIIKDFKARQSITEEAQLLNESTLNKKFKKSTFILGETVRGEISVNPLLFARGFARYLKQHGVRIYEHTEATTILENHATTPRAEIIFEKAIICRGTYEKSYRLETFLTSICLTKKLSKQELRDVGFLETQMFSDNEGHSFFYGKITKNRRLMVGYGDLKHEKRIPYEYVHPPHIRTIERFLKKTFPTTKLTIEYAWSAPYAISKADLPLVELSANRALINGGGTQITTIVAVEIAVAKLLKKKHPLQSLLLKKKSP